MVEKFDFNEPVRTKYQWLLKIDIAGYRYANILIGIYILQNKKILIVTKLKLIKYLFEMYKHEIGLRLFYSNSNLSFFQIVGSAAIMLLPCELSIWFTNM